MTSIYVSSAGISFWWLLHASPSKRRKKTSSTKNHFRDLHEEKLNLTFAEKTTSRHSIIVFFLLVHGSFYRRSLINTPRTKERSGGWIISRWMDNSRFSSENRIRFDAVQKKLLNATPRRIHVRACIHFVRSTPPDSCWSQAIACVCACATERATLNNVSAFDCCCYLVYAGC